jgi:hypothetical protein
MAIRHSCGFDSYRMVYGPGIVSITTSETGDVAEKARNAGQLVYTLPDSGVDGREGFFLAVRKQLPLDPPIIGTRSWDALSDSLSAGLGELEHDRLVIIWPNSAAMAKADPSEYEIAIAVLRHVVETLGNPAFTRNRPKQVTVYLA